MSWEAVIGLEVHVQLATASKIFSGSATTYGAEPNRQASAVDLGLPGTLPVLNEEVVRMAIRFGLAVDAEIAEHPVFARKNYFYPDLPKGYQISQLDDPIVGRGALEIVLDDGGSRTIGITRAHLEEDAGKSLHEAIPGATGIDLNRAGTPLLEIVSEPELRSAAEAKAYLQEIHAIVRCLGISDGNMNEGSMRCDANVSVRPRGETTLGTRAEVKNVNSFRFLERAIEHEIERQIELLEGGGTVVQETRLYDADRDETRSMRSKEEAEDYRYFPDPDLLPVAIDPALVESIRAELPELPAARRRRYAALGLAEDTARLLAADRDRADYFDAVAAAADDAGLAANWVVGDVTAELNRRERGFDEPPVPAADLGALIVRIKDGTISSKIAKTVFEVMLAEGGAPDEIIRAQGLEQVSDTGALEALVDAAIADNPAAVDDYRAGKKKAMGAFVGHVMKASGGKADPKQVNALLRQRLGGLVNDGPMVLDDGVRARAAAPEMPILRAQRASRLPPAAFALTVAGAVFAVVVLPVLGSRPGAADIVVSGLFFGASLAVLVGFTPRIFPGAATDLRRLGPVLPLDADELDVACRALVRSTPRSVLAMTALGVALGLLHCWLLGLFRLPIAFGLTQGFGTLALWIAMFWTVPPLLENASLFSNLGARAHADLYRPERLAPFGAAALRPTLLIIGVLCAYPLLAIGSDGGDAGPASLGFLASLVSAFGLFFLPLRGIRRRIKETRTRTLDELDARIDTLRGSGAPTAPPPDAAALTAHLALRERIARASAWPLDLAGVRRVMLYVVLPPLTWAAAAFVEMAIDAGL